MKKRCCRGGNTLFLRRFRDRRCCRVQHILDKNTTAARGIRDHHVRDRADELAVLNDGATRHECGQEGTTKFNGNFMNFIGLG